MTAKDSKSTPKKAEDATRHPLALLAEVREAAQSIARTRRDWEGSLLERRLAELESALRAQAPAAVGGDALAREVHGAWRDGMLSQGREVAPHRLTWDTLSPDDHALDAYIAQRVASAALRAQAEAEAGLRHLLRRAHAFVGGIREVRRESGNFAREFRWRTPTSTEKLHDELTAALAQAGGEG